MSILVRDELIKKSDGEFVKGFVLIKAYTKQPTKTGGSYIGGSLEAKGSMQFKVWSNADCFDDMDKYDYQERVCFVSGKVNVYMGAYSLVLETCRVVDEESEGVSKSEFYEEKYSATAFWNNLMGTVKKNTTEDGFSIVEEVLNESVRERFCEEFAAVGHHDNCRSGLLAHTAKAIKIATVLKMYPSIMERVSSDLLFVSMAIHDVGKIREYNNGVISSEGKFISHNISGIMILEEHKERIIELKGESFYIELCSIVATHHGEYGEVPRTIASYIVHLIDCFESNLTSVNQLLEVTEKDNQITIGSMKLI